MSDPDERLARVLYHVPTTASLLSESAVRARLGSNPTAQSALDAPNIDAANAQDSRATACAAFGVPRDSTPLPHRWWRQSLPAGASGEG